MAETKKSTKKIIDIAHPNQSAPAGNSKSVIITRRPVIQDPMVVEGESKEADTVAETVATPAKKVNIQPLTAPTLPGSAGADDPEPAPAEGTETAPDDEPAPNAEPESTSVAGKKIISPIPSSASPQLASPTIGIKSSTAATTSSATDPEANQTIPADEPATQDEQSDKKKTLQGDKGIVSAAAQQDIIDDEKAEADAALQKLADDKTYYLPINSLEKQRTKRNLVLGLALSVVLAAAWIDISLDAGLLHLQGIHPLTHFFSS